MSVLQNTFEKQSSQFEQSRFGAMAIMLTVQSCLGSIAAMLALQNDNYSLLMVAAALSMGSNAAFISLAPAKWCVGIFYASIIGNLMVILISLFTS